jgi:hypothetical protein
LATAVASSVQRNGEQQHGRIHGLEVVPLRRDCDEVTCPELGLQLSGMHPDTSTQAYTDASPGLLCSPRNRPAASAMTVCPSRAPGLPYTVTELRPLSAVVALLSWSSTSPAIDATFMRVDAGTFWEPVHRQQTELPVSHPLSSVLGGIVVPRASN